MPLLLAACGKSAVVTTAEKVTIVATRLPASKEKKKENLTIIVYPPGTRGTAANHPIPPLPSTHLTRSPGKQ